MMKLSDKLEKYAAELQDMNRSGPARFMNARADEAVDLEARLEAAEKKLAAVRAVATEWERGDTYPWDGDCPCDCTHCRVLAILDRSDET